MSDGIDGLAGMQALISTLAISAIITLMDRELIHEPYLDVFRGAIGGYLLVNLAIVSRRKVFLGDAGSMMIGFICAWIAIYYAQLPPAKGLPPSLALWIFAVPVMDTMTLIVRRLLLGRSPFSADRKHLHHIFLRLGFKLKTGAGRHFHLIHRRHIRRIDNLFYVRRCPHHCGFCCPFDCLLSDHQTHLENKPLHPQA